MSGKKVSFGIGAAAPAPKGDQKMIDAWVNSKAPAGAPPQPDREATKRLTLDIPVSLHTRIKSQCAGRGTKMVEEIEKLLQERYPAKEAG